MLPPNFTAARGKDCKLPDSITSQPEQSSLLHGKFLSLFQAHARIFQRKLRAPPSHEFDRIKTLLLHGVATSIVNVAQSGQFRQAHSSHGQPHRAGILAAHDGFLLE
jgi:hypothetical protein